MKYSLEKRLAIGLEIYNKQITIYEAANKYDINLYTARDYMRLYRDKNQLPDLDDASNKIVSKPKKEKQTIVYDDLDNMSKEQLIDEVIKARIDCERAKKGYLVKGDGVEKEFISIKSLNLK